MANETIGHIDCPFGEGCVGEVRRYKTASAKLYWACEHGKITPNLGPGQQWIADRMRPVDATEKNIPRGQEYTPSAEAEAPKPKPKPRRKSLLAALWDDEDDDE